MSKVTDQDIIKFNELYQQLHTYAAVARATGFSASTVSKYIKKDYIPAAQLSKVVFDKTKISMDVPQLDLERLGDYCVLSDEEIAEIEELWKEIVI